MTSVGAHVLLGAVVLVLATHAAPRLDDPQLPITFVLNAPIPEFVQPTPVVPPPPARREPRPEPKTESRPTRAVEPPPVPKVEPKDDVAPPVAKPEPPRPQPPKPAAVVRTNVFGNTSPEPRPAVPQRSVAAAKGFERESDPERSTAPQHAVAVTQEFNRVLEHAQPVLREPAVLATAGFEGTIHPSPQEGHATPRAPIVSTGLDAAAARPTSKHSANTAVRSAELDAVTAPPQARSTNTAVRSGGFDVAAATERRAKPRAEVAATAVEIISKPNPVYTEEARRLRIEGDVVLRVTFGADGTLVIHGVVDSLGHGLDAAAVDAAKKVVFKPARQNGQPVDYTAVLRVVFRLA